MSKVTTVLAFVLLTAAGALAFACGDSPNNPPPATPTGGPGPAASSAQPSTPAPPKGGW